MSETINHNDDKEIDWQCDRGICDYNARACGNCDCYNAENDTDADDIS